MNEHWINLLWRIPVAALCFWLAWLLVRRIIEVNEEGVKFEMLGPVFIGAPMFVLILLLVGIMALSPRSPTLARALFSAAADSVGKYLEHWTG
jgi:hypothetical protein